MDSGSGAKTEECRGKTPTAGRKTRLVAGARNVVARAPEAQLCERKIATTRLGDRKAATPVSKQVAWNPANLRSIPAPGCGNNYRGCVITSTTAGLPLSTIAIALSRVGPS